MQNWHNVKKLINVNDDILKKLTKIKYLIISVDAIKAFDKIQHPFLIKTLKKLPQPNKEHLLKCFCLTSSIMRKD
jgi:predicted nucleotide-binding protein (sugar kinase/HSP70/actin superfamily)